LPSTSCGTFTDVVVANDEGRLTIGKGLTTKERIFQGMAQGLTVVAEQLGEPNVGALLRKADLFTYGTTTATNAVIEGRTGKTAFLTTDGFPDILVLREGGKTNAYVFDCPPFTQVLTRVPRIAAFLVRGPKTLPLRFVTAGTTVA
jgi:N-methylhydantoinase A/oxoprolinase/acetone carboxylase beta subunit